MKKNRIPKRILTANVSWVNLSPDRFRYLPCQLCGSFANEVLASIVINWSEFYVVRCQRCKLIWRNPIPDERFLIDLYGEKYFEVGNYPADLIDQLGIADTDESEQSKRRDITKGEVKFWMQERRILPYDGHNKQRKLLEIGGGRGYLQRAAAEAGWNTIGLEISPHGIKEAISRGLTVFPIILDDLCDKYLPYSRYFDVVVFFDFLEHVTDPGRVLRMVRSILTENGDVILRIPCIEDNECPKWHLIDHIWHFTTGMDRPNKTDL